MSKKKAREGTIIAVTCQAPVPPEPVQERWKPEWVQDVVLCLGDQNKGKQAITQLPWYRQENGFDRSKHYAEGECIDLRGLSLQEVSLARADLTAARFDSSSFIDVDLNGAKLKFATMRGCNFVRTDLSQSDLSAADLNGGQFYLTNISKSDCTGARFTDFNFAWVDALGTNFHCANFSNSTVQKVNWDKLTSFLSVNLRGATFTHSPLLKRHIEDQNWLAAKKAELSQSRLGSVLWSLWGFTSCHGQSFLRWLLVSFIMALLYGIGYQFLPLEIKVHNVHPVLAKFYFSIVTFTTLGFGDVLPKSNVAATVVMTEVICGYLMLGALISILADKFARRS